MDAADRIALEEGGNRRRVAERLDQFDLAVRQFDEDGRDAVLGSGTGSETCAPSVSR